MVSGHCTSCLSSIEASRHSAGCKVPRPVDKLCVVVEKSGFTAQQKNDRRYDIAACPYGAKIHSAMLVFPSASVTAIAALNPVVAVLALGS